MPSIPELLCPAGDINALKAAVDSGADAVYLGYKAFGARASAVNFDQDSLSEAVRYAHLYHARVHVTVNTLIKEHEFSALHETLDAIAASGADAVIVQDLGVASLVRDEYPMLALHASTQMGLSNAADAAFAKEFGFSRVVLARECSLSEIRKVVATGIETEVFAHGALCSGVSGRCLMSSMAGGRSGNRGRCAQPCRLQLRLGERKGALLSLRDLCTLEYLEAFCDAGVCSLKVEGRLKSPEYVAVVTGVYRKALDQIAAGTFDPHDPAPMEALRQIFNRGGFTKGHAFGAEDAEMCASQRVSHEGVSIGAVTKVRGSLAHVRLTRSLNDGDSLQIRGRQDGDMRYSGHDVSAGEEATLRLRPGLQPREGDEVARLSDARQLESARNHHPKPILITMDAAFALDQPMQLQISDGISTISVTGDRVQAAQKRAATADDVRKQLEKLGETPYQLKTADSLHIALEAHLFLPVSALNELRRKGVEALTEARIAAFDAAGRSKVSVLSKAESASAAVSATEVNQLTVVFPDATMGKELLACGADRLIYEPVDLRPEALRTALAQLPEGCLVQLPPQMTQSALDNALSCIRKEKDRIAGIVAGCVGQVAAAEGMAVWAGPGIPVSNRRSLETVCAMGVKGFHLWPEWSGEELRQLLPYPKPALLKVYGREILMLLNHCPERVARGLSANRSACSLCKDATMACGTVNPVLVDQKSYRFPLQRTVFPEGCILRVLGSLPTDLRQYDAQRRAMGVGMLIQFTVESPLEQKEITRQFAAIRDGALPQKPENTTASYWRRGIE